MDLTDKKLLKLLSLNSRYQHSTLAKALNISKDSVKRRIRKLENTHISGYTTMIDMRALGYEVNHLLITLNSKHQSQHIIEQARQHKATTFVSEHAGLFDIQIIYHVHNSFERFNTTQELLNMCAKQLKNYKHIIHIKDYQFRLETNTRVKEPTPRNDSSFSKQLSLISKPNIGEVLVESVDDKDKKILHSLTKNPRERLTTIAEQVQLSSQAVKKRIEQLIKKKIIYGFSLYPDHSKLQQFNHMILFKTRPHQDNNTLKTILSTRDHILFAADFTGEYTMVVYVLAQNPEEFKTRFEEIKEAIGTQIISYDLSMVTKIHKFQLLSENFFS